MSSDPTILVCVLLAGAVLTAAVAAVAAPPAPANAITVTAPSGTATYHNGDVLTGIEKTHQVWKTKAGGGLQREYSNVKCVEYLHRIIWCGQTLREQGNSHWVRETGRWYLIFDSPYLAM
jgi:hypothetical protein